MNTAKLTCVKRGRRNLRLRRWIHLIREEAAAAEAAVAVETGAGSTTK
jgi:hypothetical protein